MSIVNLFDRIAATASSVHEINFTFFIWTSLFFLCFFSVHNLSPSVTGCTSFKSWPLSGSAVTYCTCFAGPLCLMFFSMQSCAGESSARKRDILRLALLIRKTGSVAGLGMDPVEKVVEQRTPSKIKAILSNRCHPLNWVFSHQRSSRGSRLLPLGCTSERLTISCVPRAIRLYNAATSGRSWRWEKRPEQRP